MTLRLRILLTLWLGMALAPALAGAPKQHSPSRAGGAVGDFSGTYTFLRDGEDLQLNVENGRLDGFLSRYGDSEADRDVLLQHFLEKTSVEGDSLSFTTDKIHGVWFEFKGRVRRGDAKTTLSEGYYVLEGTITRYETGNDKKTTARSRGVQFRSLPMELGPTLPDPNKTPPPHR